MAKSKAGRPTVMTPEVLSKLERAFSLGCSDPEACVFANISTTALYDYQNKYPEFAERKALLKEKPVLLARQTVVRALESDHKHALKYLELKKSNEFKTVSEQTNINLTPQDVINKLAEEEN